MKTNPDKTTPRAYHTLRQIVQLIPRWLIDRTANAHGNAPLKVFNSIIAPLGYKTPRSVATFDARQTPQETRVKYPKRRASYTSRDARRLPQETRVKWL